MGVETGSSQSKTVSIFHGNTLLFTCVTSSSCHLHRGNNTNQESGSGKSSTSRADAVPQLPKTRSNQTIFSLNRSASFPFEESESPLAKLLEKPPRPYILTPDIRITVPCFVHEVQSLFSDPDTNAYIRHANGMQESSFVTSEKLEIRIIGHHSPSGYLLARPWDLRLCYASSNTYHNSLSLLRERLANPFFRLLLEPSNDGQFRRISTGARIDAELDPPQAPSQKYGVRFLNLR